MMNDVLTGGINQDGAAAILAAGDELEVFTFRRFLVGRNFCDDPSVRGQAWWEKLALEEISDVIFIAMMFPIRRIGENEIIDGGISFEKKLDLGFDRVPAFEMGFSEVLGDDLDGLALLVHEGAMVGTAAECFKSQSTRTSIEIKNSGLLYFFTEDGKHGLADKIRGRTGNGGGDFDRNAASFTCDNSHGC